MITEDFDKIKLDVIKSTNLSLMIGFITGFIIGGFIALLAFIILNS